MFKGDIAYWDTTNSSLLSSDSLVQKLKKDSNGNVSDSMYYELYVFMMLKHAHFLDRNFFFNFFSGVIRLCLVIIRTISSTYMLVKGTFQEEKKYSHYDFSLPFSLDNMVAFGITKMLFENLS